LLLGSTALVSAGLLLGGAASAQEIEVTLGGYTEFGALGATDETLQGDPDRGYTFFMDNEVHIQATGVSDGGLTYGSYLEMEAGSGSAPALQDDPANNDNAGEVRSSSTRSTCSSRAASAGSSSVGRMAPRT
ncbi:MAG: hypothetical protein K0R41_3844, partial [Geminicoccaceae bacterium]|nr:hypothetical protein [Geminicoccaceae bacterium]